MKNQRGEVLEHEGNLASKQQVNNKFANSKSDGKTGSISQAMQNGNISSFAFHRILQEAKKYYKLEARITHHAKDNVKR